MNDPIWIGEADVVSIIDLGDAVRAIEAALLAEARGDAHNMHKTHVVWETGTLHAIGAVSSGFAATKTWAHTEKGATPLVLLYDSTNGSLKAIIEAFALGQLRTGAISGVATRWLANADAREMAIIGTGRQALAQVAAVAVVRPIERVRVFSRDAEHRKQFAARVREELEIDAHDASSIAGAVRNVPIVTTVTRAREPFLSASMISAGTHINAVGAIMPAAAEVANDLIARCDVIAADSVEQAKKLSSELAAVKNWDNVRPLSEVVAAHRIRSAEAVTIFKSLGMGISLNSFPTPE